MKKLTELRQARGWSKAELARRAHLAEGDVGKIESGRLVPYEAQLRRLARVLDVPTAKATQWLAEPHVVDRLRDVRPSRFL